MQESAHKKMGIKCITDSETPMIKRIAAQLVAPLLKVQPTNIELKLLKKLVYFFLLLFF